MSIKKISNYPFKRVIVLVILVLVLVPVFFLVFSQIYQKQIETQRLNDQLSQQTLRDSKTIEDIKAEIDRLNTEDLRVTNTQVTQEIVKLKSIYKATVVAYESLLDLQGKNPKVTAQESLFASVLNFLAKDDLMSAQKSLDELNKSINTEKAKLIVAATVVIPANVLEVTEPPGAGYRRQKVTVDGVSYLVDIISADLNSTKVIVDTASESTCGNNCPVLSLVDYVNRSGAYAGINGGYFCPESYPSCADKKNSFDTLLMNKKKVYFNSDNNVYSTVPAVIFSQGSARFVAASQEWGRDTNVDGVIANRSLLVLNGTLMTGGTEEKEVIKSNRSFVGASGSTVYIGVVYNASVAQAAKVIFTLGIKNAINLDSGGSTALWSGGYKAGPGRNIPNAVLFVKR